MKRRREGRRIDGWSFRYFSRQSLVTSCQWSSPEEISSESGGKKNGFLLLAPDFSLGIPRLKA
jgi:hypothetical protein